MGQPGVNKMGISTWVPQGVQELGPPPARRGEGPPQRRSGGVWVPLSPCKLVTPPGGGGARAQAEPTGPGAALVLAHGAESRSRNSARARKEAKPYPKEKTQSRD